MIASTCGSVGTAVGAATAAFFAGGALEEGIASAARFAGAALASGRESFTWAQNEEPTL